MTCRLYGKNGMYNRLIETNGNQCGLRVDSHAPCLMEMRGVAPNESTCGLIAMVRQQATLLRDCLDAPKQDSLIHHLRETLMPQFPQSERQTLLKEYPLGTRLRLTEAVDRYPHFQAAEGLLGVVWKLDEHPVGELDAIWVKMIEPLPNSEEWENCITWTRDDGGLELFADQVTKIETVVCSLCEKECDDHTAHLHQGKWIGECCWDERLRSSE